MNAAARTLTESNIFSSELKKISISVRVFWLSFLLFSLLSSAIASVYVTNLQRQYVSELEILHKQTDRLTIEYNQLLLEQSTWLTPARVEKIAAQEFSMKFPRKEQIILLSR